MGSKPYPLGEQTCGSVSLEFRLSTQTPSAEWGPQVCSQRASRRDMCNPWSGPAARGMASSLVSPSSHLLVVREGGSGPRQWELGTRPLGGPLGRLLLRLLLVHQSP